MAVGRVRISALLACLCALAAGMAVAVQPQSAVEEARQQLSAGQPRTAAITLKNHLQQEPDSGPARLWLGRIYLLQGDGRAALKEIQRAQALDVPREELIADLGQAYWLAGRYEELLEQVRSLPNDSQALSVRILHLRAQSHLALKAYPEAEQAYRALIALRPDTAAGYLGLAELALEGHEQAEGAEAMIDRALSLEPDSAEAWSLKGFLLREREQPGTAIDAFDRALSANPQHLKAQLGRAMALLSLGRAEEALMQGEQTLKGYPGHVLAHYLVTQALLSLERYQQAYEGLQQVTQYDTQIPQINLLTGTAAVHLGHYYQAEHYLRRYLSHHPGHRQATQLLAAVLGQLRKPVEQLEVLKQAPADEDANYYALMGDAYLAKGDLEQSRTQFERAAELDPQLGHVRSRLGEARIRQGDLEAGIAELEKALALGDQDVATEVLLVRALLRQGALKRAGDLIARLERRLPDGTTVLQLRSLWHLAGGQPARARELLQQALVRQPRAVALLFNLALLEVRTGRLGEAEDAYRRILAIDADHWAALFGLAMLAEHQGDVIGARTLLQRGHQAHPEVPGPAGYLVAFLLRHGDHASALAVLNRPVLRDLDDESLLKLRAQALLQADDLAATAEALERLASHLNGSAEVRYLLGGIYLALQQPDLAAERLQAALALRSDYPEALLALGRATFSGRGDQAALEVVAELEQRYPNGGYAEQLRGYIAYLTGEFEQARRWYEKAHAHSGRGDQMAAAFRARIHAGEGRAVLEAMNAWLAEHPDDGAVRGVLSAVLTKRAQALRQAGVTDAAIDAYDQALALDPDNLIILGRLSMLHHDQGHPKAVDYARRAFEVAPFRPEVEATYGWLRFLYGDPNDGLALLQQAVEQAPDRPGLRLQWATALDRAGQYQQALEVLEPVFDNGASTALGVHAERLRERLTSQQSHQ